MRYWYDSDNLSWTSNDGYKIWLDSDIPGYKLYNPEGFCIRVWLCEDLRKEIGDLDIKLYEYVFYKAERFLTLIDSAIERALNKAVCTRDYSVKHCMNCKHLLFKDYRHNDGTCGYTHRIKSFYDCCDQEVNND